MRTSYALACVIALCLALVAGSAFAANILQNPGFESGATGWTASLRAPSTGTVVSDPAVAHGGSNYWVASAPEGSAATSWISVAQGAYDAFTSGVTIPISGQKYYQLSAWVKVPSAATTPVDIALRYRWQPSGDRVDVGLQTINTDGWVQLVSPLLKPRDTDTSLGYFEIHSNSFVTYYADDCVLDELDPYVVSGKVVDQVGNPVSGASVSLDTSSAPTSVPNPLAKAITDANGNYSVKIPPLATPTNYYVNAAHPVYEELSGAQMVTVPPSPATAPNIVLNALPLCKVSGKVIDQATGAGIAGVTVAANLMSGAGIGPDSLTAVSGADGSYSIQLVVGQMYYVIARKFGLVPAGTQREWEIWTVDDSGMPKDTTLDIQMVADEPLVRVEAAALPNGPMATWTNTGSLGGAFEPIGTTTPVAGALGQYRSAYFDNNPMVLKKDGARVLAPASITGATGAYTVSAWLFDTDMPDQQTYIAWAKRGGPDGTNCEMVYGTNATWGATGHWGAPDMSWGTAVSPSAGAWHNVVITWDGSTETAYIDGVSVNSETKTLAIAPDLPIVLGAGYDYASDPAAEDYQTIYPGVVFSGHMAKVEIYANVAGPADAAAIAAATPPSLPVATIQGKIVTSDGSAPSGFAVSVKDPAGTMQGFATTTATGTYSFSVAAPGSYTVSVKKSGFAVRPGPQSVSFAAPGEIKTLTDFLATPTSISGVIKDAVTGKPIYNAVVQIEGQGGPAMVTDVTGAYSFPAAGGCGGVEIFADALGYHCANLLIDSVGTMTKTILLAPEAETDVLVNGGFEDVVNGVPTNWSEYWVAGGLQFNASTTAFSGNYSAWYTGTASYSAMAQYVPVLPGYVYTGYFKAKADPEVKQWFPMFSFRSAAPADGEMKGWVSGELEKDGWVHTPPYDWYQYLKFHTYSGDPVQPFVRIAPPAGAANIAASFCFAELPVSGKGAYVDDVVIDKVAANEPLVLSFPDGGAKLYGVNNKSVANDGKLVGKAVKAWGKVLSVNGTSSFVMSDGYSTGVTVKIGGVTLPAGFGTDKMAVVTGVVNADKSIQATEIAVF